MSGRPLFRVLDANLNRAREGLRVCEEVARMIGEDPPLTRRCQRLRYELEQISRALPRGQLLAARDARRDVGRPAARGRTRTHRGWEGLATANLKRVQEALRVLEEFARIRFPEAAKRFGSLRFRTYTLEQAFHSGRLPVRHR